MSTQNLTEQTTKKRKHTVADGVAGEPSVKRSKVEEKKAKKEHKGKEKRKAKGKARADDGQFQVFQASLALSIPPVFANNLRAGAEEMLDSTVMRYIPALHGVVLSHGNLQFLESAATVKADCPFANVHVGFEATVWCPQVGMKLVGKVNLCSPDHVSLLVHRTFNVSIPQHHIPIDNWEFEYGPAENDPEFGAAVVDEIAIEMKEGESSGGAEGSGRWVHKVTGTVLGGPTGDLEFTVIGLTIANQMLSLVGSIQADPFSIEEERRQSVQATTSQPERPSVSPGDNSAVEAMLDGGDVSSNNNEEPFVTLSKRANRTVAEDAESRTREEDEVKAEKKRKRKEKKSGNASDLPDAKRSKS